MSSEDGSDRDNSLDRIIAARMRLRERFFERIEKTPGRADDQPMGSGPPNRHGMPKLPVGQAATAAGKWPVLDLGPQPVVPPEDWQLQISGEVRRPQVLGWDAFLRLEQVDDVSDFHCVTGWSKLDVAWQGVRFSTVAALVEPDESARFVVCHSYDGYSTNLPLEEALKDDVLLAYGAEGHPLTREHGGPVRLVVPQLYAWKSAKWIRRIEFLRDDCRGYWERLGYSNTAHPWRNDRYSR